MPRGKDPAPASWGPPPLTARPEGLLASLGIQSGGRYPQHLLPDLQPTYELGPWYREYNGTFRSGNVAFATSPPVQGETVDLFTVPDGEIWILNRLAAKVTVPSGNRWAYYLQRVNAAGGTELVLCNATSLNWTSSPTAHTLPCYTNGPPIILRPTVTVQAVSQIASIAAGSITVNWDASILICKI